MLHDNHPNCNPEIVQAACKKFESEISDLKNRLKTQESETQKSNSKFEFSVPAQEKLKKKFEAERKAWADEKLLCSAGPNKRKPLLLKEPPSYPA